MPVTPNDRGEYDRGPDILKYFFAEADSKKPKGDLFGNAGTEAYGQV